MKQSLETAAATEWVNATILSERAANLPGKKRNYFGNFSRLFPLDFSSLHETPPENPPAQTARRDMTATSGRKPSQRAPSQI